MCGALLTIGSRDLHAAAAYRWPPDSTQANCARLPFFAVASTYVKVRCEGDRGKLKYASNKEGEAATFEDAIFIFVILHSNAEFLIKVKDDKDASFYGQVGPHDAAARSF